MGEENSPRGKGKWIAVGCVFAFLVVGGFFSLPYLSKRFVSARLATCKSNLRGIALACRECAEVHDGEFPPTFAELVPDHVDDPKIFKCPSGSASWRDFKPGGTITEASSSYVYVPGLRSDMPGDFILAYDKHENHERPGCNVAFVDGHVEWRRSEEDLARTLATQREAVAAWRKSGKPIESLKEIYAKILESKE